MRVVLDLDTKGGLDMNLDLFEKKNWILTSLPSTNINQYNQGKLIVSLFFTYLQKVNV